MKQSAVKIVVDRVARQFSTSVLYKGKKRQWGSMIMLKTRVDDSTFHNLRMMRTYDKRPFLSSFFEWLNAYHNSELPSADF